jgi:phage head maturation protease
VAISDRPWSDFSQADYTPEQWRRACAVDTSEGDPGSKERYKVPLKEPDGTLNRNAVHAAAAGHGLGAVTGISSEIRRKAAKKIIAAYREMGEEVPESMMSMADMSTAGRSAAAAQISLTYARTFELDDIQIVSRAKGGDGRTVEAYAAVFNTPTEIHDQHGDYVEQIDPAAFNRTTNSGGMSRALVLYNHGYDARGKSGGLPTVPIGRPVEIRADKRGLLTVSRYNESEFADTVLASIRNGDITAQSFEGPIYRSDPPRPVGKQRAGRALPKVRRLELGLRNYGPTPTPYYPDAEITAVRSAAELAEDFARLDEAGREELIRALSTTPGWDPETAAILATPSQGLGAEDPRDDAHSVRSHLLRLRAELLFNGVR